MLSLGLNPETADMLHYKPVSMKEWGVLATPFTDECRHSSCYFPAWSLGRLMEMMPDKFRAIIPSKRSGGCSRMTSVDLMMTNSRIAYYYEDEDGEDTILVNWFGEKFDNVIVAIKWLIKEGKLNKEYLVKANE